MTQLWTPVKKMTASAFAAFGPGDFGRRAESFARFFGTPTFLMVQTVVVVVWIAVNAAAATYEWDPYPFILLNLMFSLQAAYAAPLILLAQTRQAERDRLMNQTDAEQRESIARATITNQEELVALVRQLADDVSRSQSLIQRLAGGDEQDDPRSDG